MIRQELNPVTCKLDEKQIKAGTSMSAPIDITGNWWVSLLVPVSSVPPAPPALLLLGERTEGRKKREVLHLFRCYTHTCTRPEPGQPWKAKGRKKRTQTTGKGPKQRRGGRGTDGPPKPTYTAKRTWPKQRTHLNPTTHYGEARGEN